jgi:heme oxygenase (mycobilin-producing)
METLLLTFNCKKGAGSTMVEVLHVALKDTRAFEGCMLVDMYCEASNPDRVVLYEKWTSREAQQAYMAWRVTSGTMNPLLPLLDGPIEEVWLVEQ